ncbi:ROK family protein [Alkalihalophilus lindianensis]|uniref:ROK family protein n=1 Tax=Alkalihalophilus lindianensis TaxID=1630542 RepID=A0ABU3X8P6_9BACI|nr:ROK family protein [Alkalihalophilus lindianensis]MDV2684263.1 ROK family protein [Alkalihalophilus lindianensis]
MKVLGIDIGGTKINMGVVDREGKVYTTHTIPTSFPLYETLEKEIIHLLSTNEDVEAIGIGTAGLIDTKHGKVLYASDNLPGWSGTEVKARLEAAVNLNVEIDNDANVAALAEVKLGVAKNFSRALLLTLGTGVGGGVIINGRILTGPNGGVGEFGHMILYPGGILCSCGRKGCKEQYISGKALQRRIHEAGLSYSPEELMKYKASIPQAKEIIRSYTFDLAVSISSLQAALDIEVVVLGGGVSDSADYWIEELREQLKPLLLNPLEVKVATFKSNAGMLGAAQLVLDQINATNLIEDRHWSSI